MSPTGRSRLRAAVIGVGFVGAQHVDAVRRIGAEVVVVAGSQQLRAESAASVLGVARATGDWEAAVSDPNVDVVHVCVPNDLHLDVVLAALDAAKHVVCEKPLGLDVTEALRLARAAERTDRVAVLCHNYRFFPMVAELRHRVSAGALGPLHAIRGAYLQDWLLLPTTTNWRVDAVRGGRSRAVADIGTHWIDLAETVTQRRLESVLADVRTIHQRRPAPTEVETFSGGREGDGAWVDVGTEDQAGLLLRFEGDLQATLALSQVAAGHGNDLQLSVDGASGSATWRQERPDELWLATPDGLGVVQRSRNQLGPGAKRLARLPAGHSEGWADALRNLLSAAYDQVSGGRDPAEADAAPLPTFGDGVRHLAFVDAALQSARQERWVTITDVMAKTAAAVS